MSVTDTRSRVCRHLGAVDPTESCIPFVLEDTFMLTRISLTVDGIISPKSTAPPRSTSHSRSNSRVQFDLDSNVEFPHDEQRRTSSRDHRSYSDSEETVMSQQRSSNRKSRRHRGRRDRDPASQLFNDKYDRTPSGYDSDGTMDLPPRFDRDGNRKAESTGNDLADRIQDLLAGRGSAGKLFKGLAGGLLEGGGGGERDGRRGGRRGRRGSE